MSLEPIEFANGFFSLLCVIISTIIGVIILSKYFKHKEPTLLLVGSFWIGLFSPWWSSAISFILILFTGQGLDAPIYFILGNALSPLIVIIWIIVFTELKFKKSQKIIIGLYIIIEVLFEIVFFYYIFTDPTVIGELSGYFDVTYKGLVMLHAIFIVLTLLVTGILFGLELRKSDNHDNRLKGFFIIIAIISWCVGAILDAALPLDIILLTITRLILISSAIEFYFGFFLPKFFRKT